MKGSDDGAASGEPMNTEDFYYRYNYIRNNIDLSQVVAADAGIPVKDVSFSFDDDNLTIKALTTKANFNKIAEKMKEVLTGIIVEVKKVQGYVLINDYKTPDGK